MDDKGHIIAVAPRHSPATQPIIGISLPLTREQPEPTRITVGDITVTIYPGVAVIITSPAELMISTRSANTSPLGKNEAIVRFDPAPAVSNSKATEMVGK